MAQKLTVFQKLSRALDTESNGQAYIIDPKSFTNLDASEVNQKKLEAQQTYYLQNQWKKIDNELYQKAVYYEPTRMASYFDYEAMEYCIAGDTKIATPDGFITIKELADKGRDHEFITYAYDHNLKKVVPAIARNAHYTRDEMTYKVIFDDGSYIITTWEHQLMKRDGSFERVMNLKPGDSMMPFYRKSFYDNQKYNWVYTCNEDEGTNGWVAEHNLITEWFYGNIGKNEEVHHIDFNGKNNNPAYIKIPFDLIIEAARIEKTLKKTAKALNISYRKIQRDIVNSGYRDWNTFILAYGIEKSKYSTTTTKGNQLQLNHKIVSIVPHAVIPVYDLTVPGYKNFATDTIFSHNTPEIAVALDIFADEATTANENGKILSIYSESTRIKNELTELFENVLDINTNLTSWARNLCKYGDNFVYNKIVPKRGIVGCIQLPNIEITRTEPGFAPIRDIHQYDNENNIAFHWNDKNIEFNSFEVSHFRLLGDDRKLPYGTSLLEKVRRIWKQLLLSEDAMLVYRTTRAPERRVYKIFVGNMDDKDVDAYVDKIANNFKRTSIVNANNGQQDTRYNPLAVDQDYFIPVRDPSLANPIDTLPGATNLSEIADIEYIQKKMLAALRVPKAFLGFDEATGDGKNLAILDIRFARAVHRIQKALIQELNKMAIIHLYLKGYEDDLTNFTLSLTTPSTQADILKVQNWKEKITLYRDAVSDAGNGFGATSMTFAKKEILGMSEDDIKLDIQRQAVEKAGSEELKMLAETIKQTGLFREIYKAYKINPDNMSAGEQQNNTEPGSELNAAISGGGGESSLGTDFTSPLETPGEDVANLGAETEVGAPEGGEDTGLEEPLSEIIKKNMDKRRGRITESLNKTISDIDRLSAD